MARVTPDEKPIRVYADGACILNPGPGGWAYVLPDHEQPIEAAGREPQTTNQRMELTAALHGLAATPVGSNVEVTTDSEYVVKGMTEWRSGWERRGWTNRERKPVANLDLWQRLFGLADARSTTWRWVRGHVAADRGGDPWNHRADDLAHSQALDAAEDVIASGQALQGRCIADIGGGRKCLKPARILDRARGGLVCAVHAPVHSGEHQEDGSL